MPDRGQPVGQVVRVVDAEVEPHAAQRIVDMAGVAGEQHATATVGGGNALMHRVEIGVQNAGSRGLRHEARQAPMSGCKI